MTMTTKHPFEKRITIGQSNTEKNTRTFHSDECSQCGKNIHTSDRWVIGRYSDYRFCGSKCVLEFLKNKRGD